MQFAWDSPVFFDSSQERGHSSPPFRILDSKFRILHYGLWILASASATARSTASAMVIF